MKIKPFVLACMLLMQFAASAQMKIGDNPTNINNASVLELESVNKGFVLPRIVLESVSSPNPLDPGLLSGTVVYNTNEGIAGGGGIGTYAWNGLVWELLSSRSIPNADSWNINGNLGITAANFIGTGDAADLVVKTNNVERLRIPSGGDIGIGGLAAPRALLDVTGNISAKNLITLQNQAVDGYSSVDMLDNFGNLAGTFGYANPGTGFLKDRDYFNVYNKDFVITALVPNSNPFFLQGSGTGYIGIGTDVPQQRLHVHGRFQLDSAFMPAGDAGLAGQVLYSQGPDLPPVWQDVANGGSGWALTGNGGTSAATNFIGTTDGVDFITKTNNAERIRISGSTGDVGINTTTPTATLDVNGTVKLGTNGTPISAIVNVANVTATTQATAIDQNAMGTATVAVANATINAPVIVSPRSATFVIAYARVTSANTVTIGIYNTTSGSIAANTTFTVDVAVVNP
jgi:hypothetical protein